MRRLSQQTVAGRLGLTFQQVQKYENGANRTSASRLYDLSNILDVPISFFFDGLKDGPSSSPDPWALRVAGRLSAVPKGPLRASILRLVESLGREPTGEGGG